MAQAAEELGLTPVAVRYRLEKGLLHGHNPTGRQWLIKRVDVERQKRAGRAKPGIKPKEHYMTAARILDRAKELVHHQNTWVRTYDVIRDPRTGLPSYLAGDDAQNRAGQPVNPTDDQAVRWSDLGAIAKAWVEVAWENTWALETAMRTYVDGYRVKQPLDGLHPIAAHIRTVQMLHQAADDCRTRGQ